MKPTLLLTYAQLVRLPNVFTAFADIALGACAAGYILDRSGVFLVLLLASGALYLSGMVLNDLFDRVEDSRARPFRPIPSGRVSARMAALLGFGLMGLGIGLAALAGRLAGTGQTLLPPVAVALALAVAILLYNGYLKRIVLGPLSMGLCRFLNVILGLSGGSPEAVTGELAIHLAAVIGVYIVGVTWFARTEETVSQRRALMGAAVVMLLALVLAITVPAHREMGTTPVYFPYLVVLFGFGLGVKVVEAIRHPGPQVVQAAIKRCIFGLVFLDAILATAFVGAPGLLILLLLLPARWLGKWVYST